MRTASASERSASAPAHAQTPEGAKGKYLFVVTSGANNPNKRILSLLLADIVQKMELGSVQLFLSLEGAELAKVDLPEKIVSPSTRGSAAPWS